MSNDPDAEAQLNPAFAALTDPSRRTIIAVHRETQAQRVNDLAACFDRSLNGVSKHLQTVERTGLIERRHESRTD